MVRPSHPIRGRIAIVTGFVVDWTGKFGIAFAIAGAISLAGIMGWVVVVRRVETLDWG